MVDNLFAVLMHVAQSARVRLFNPTRDWPERAVSRLEYDMRTHRLNGIPGEAPVELAKQFGRADWFSGGADSPELDYRQLGLQVTCWEGVIASFRVILQPTSRHSRRDRAFQAADLTLIAPNGTSCRLWGNTTEEDLIAMLGTPFETGPIGEDRVHTFLVEGNHIDSYHDAITGQLLELELVPDDRPWPSASQPPEDEPLERSA